MKIGGLRARRRASRLTGGAKDAWRHLGMYSFQIKRIHPQTPEEKFWGRFDSAPRPLLRPKEGLRPFLWKPTRRVRGVSVTKDVGTGDGGGGIVGIRGFSPCGGRGWGRLGSFGAGIGGLLPCEGTGGGTPGSSCPTGGCGKTSSTTLDGVRRRSRLAARRMVGATGRRRQRNGGFRPSSSVLGKFQEGAGAPSWFPALAAERMKSFFPATCAAGKIPLTERRVKKVRPLWGPDSFRAKAERTNHCAPGLWPGAQGRGHLKGGRQSPL